MTKRIFMASLIGSLALGSASLFAQDSQTGHGASEPPAAGIHWAKGQDKGEGKTSGSAGAVKLLLYFGGPVQHPMNGAPTVVSPIFWGTSWSSEDPKISGLQSFYTGVSESGYLKTNTEYSDASGPVSPFVSFAGPLIDSGTKAPTSGNSTSAILAEVCKTVPAPIAGGYYPVYVDQPRGSAGYCAWHSAGTCNGKSIQFAFFFNLDNDPGCTPGGDTGSTPGQSGKHSQGLANLANVSGHELSESLTDPKLNAWYDRSGNENADKCAWTFGNQLLTFSDGSTWQVQGNWSNNAYNGNVGYKSGTTFVRGCIDGTNDIKNTN